MKHRDMLHQTTFIVTLRAERKEARVLSIVSLLANQSFLFMLNFSTLKHLSMKTFHQENSIDPQALSGKPYRGGLSLTSMGRQHVALLSNKLSFRENLLAQINKSIRQLSIMCRYVLKSKLKDPKPHDCRRLYKR